MKKLLILCLAVTTYIFSQSVNPSATQIFLCGRGDIRGMAVGNINDDPGLELIVGSIPPFWSAKTSGGIVMICKIDNGGFAVKDEIPMDKEYGLISSITIGDVDNDGKNEFIIHTHIENTQDVGKIYIYKYINNTYTKIYEAPANHRTRANGIKIADVDNDNKNEIVICEDYYGRKIRILKHSQGTTFNEIWNSGYVSDITSVDVGDLDNQPGNELLFGTACWSTYNTQIYKHSVGTFNKVWEGGNIVHTYVSIGDIDRDGKNEFAVSTAGGCQYPDDLGDIIVYKYSNGSYNQFWKSEIGHPISMVYIGDPDNDGHNELIAIGANQNFNSSELTPVEMKLFIYEYVGGTMQLAFSKTLFLTNWPYEWGNLTVADVDNDGQKELVIACNDMYIFKGDFQTTSVGNNFTNNYQVKNFSLSNNYPNPFNPSTKISYTLNKSTHVALKIYDVNGGLIRTLENGNKNEGNYIVEWNGDDDFGKKVSSGVYFYSIITEEFKDTKKMIMIK